MTVPGHVGDSDIKHIISSIASLEKTCDLNRVTNYLSKMYNGESSRFIST